MRLLLSLLLWMLLRWPGCAQAVGPENRSRPGATRAATIASFPGPNTIQALAVDPSGNILVAGTTSSADFPVANALQPIMGEARIIASTDGGATWMNIGNPPVGVSSVAPNPVTPQVLLASAGTGIYKSTDGGRTWRAAYQSPTKPYSCLGSVVVDPANPLHAAALVGDGSPFDGVIVRSVDGGESWTKTGIRGDCFDSTTGFFSAELWADPAGSGALFVVDVSGAFSISRDWGLTFHRLSVPGKSATVANVAFDPSNPGSLYVTTGYVTTGPTRNLFLSTDFGATWTTKTSPNPSPFCVSNGAIVVDPDHSNTLVAYACDLYTSADGGASWKLVPRSDSFFPGTPLILTRQCRAGGNIIAFGINPNTAPPGVQLVGSSPDYGKTWSNLLQVSNVGNVVSSGCTIYAVRTLASDAFIAKLAPDGTTLWATYLGGSNADAPVALAVDALGNAYVSGNTASPDFPSTGPVLGVLGTANAFVAKISPDGALLYSTVLGASNAGAIAVDRAQSPYLIGTTSSPHFPVTPGALVTTLNNFTRTGFLLKLSPAGALSSATYLGNATSASWIVLDAQNQPILAGTGPVPGSGAALLPPVPGYVARLNATATQVLKSVQFPIGIGAIATDASGNLVVAGRGGGTCGAAFLTKLAAADWQPIYTVPSLAPCVRGLTLAMDSNDAVYMAADTSGGWPLRSWMLRQPACLYSSPALRGPFPGGSALAKLSPDASTIELGTYLGGCGVPGLAIGNDGSIYVSVSSSASLSFEVGEVLESPHSPFAAVLKLEPGPITRVR